MKAYIRGESATDLRRKLDADWQSAKGQKDLTSAAWYERAQLREFLSVVAKRDCLNYPLELFHTSATKPDFKLSFLTSAVGIEMSRITNEASNRLRQLHRTSRTPEVVSFSHVLIADARSNNAELVKESLPGGEWNTPSDEREFWLTQARAMIDRKTGIRRSTEYEDYGENWLVLWDQLSIDVDNFRRHAALLHDSLRAYWREERVFNKIILQCAEMKHHTILTDAACEHVDAGMCQAQ